MGKAGRWEVGGLGVGSLGMGGWGVGKQVRWAAGQSEVGGLTGWGPGGCETGRLKLRKAGRWEAGVLGVGSWGMGDWEAVNLAIWKLGGCGAGKLAGCEIRRLVLSFLYLLPLFPPHFHSGPYLERGIVHVHLALVSSPSIAGHGSDCPIHIAPAQPDVAR